MGNLSTSVSKKDSTISDCNGSGDSTNKKTVSGRTRHEFKVLSTEEINKNRSIAYSFITF